MPDKNNGEKRFDKLDLWHFFVFFLILLTIWFILSGRFEVKFALYGIGTCAFCAWFGVYLLKTPLSGDGRVVSFGLKSIRLSLLLTSLFWLLWEIIKANIQIALVVLNPRLPIEPSVVTFRVRFENPLSVFTLANFITLTPGTITLDVQDDVYIVHALTKKAAEGVRERENGLPCKVACRVAGIFNEKWENPSYAGGVCR